MTLTMKYYQWDEDEDKLYKYCYGFRLSQIQDNHFAMLLMKTDDNNDLWLKSDGHISRVQEFYKNYLNYLKGVNERHDGLCMDMTMGLMMVDFIFREEYFNDVKIILEDNHNHIFEFIKKYGQKIENDKRLLLEHKDKS